MESLYPFLYAGQADLDAVLAEVRQSTVAKAHEIIELRRAVAAQDATRLRACASEMASRFEAVWAANRSPLIGREEEMDLLARRWQQIKDGEGRERTLSAWRGRTVLLNLWATWCVPCRREMPALDAIKVDYQFLHQLKG